MSDQRDPHVHTRQARSASWWPVWAILRGLAIGVASAATAASVAFTIVKFAPANTSPCDSDIACLPDLGPLILAITSMPMVMAIVGPLVARLLGVSRPWFFVVPAAWGVVLACVGLGPADGQNRWPFNDTFTSIVILLAPYSLIALWTSWRQAKDRAQRTPTMSPDPPVEQQAGP
ncbi:MAG TPA: hypothetical protein VJX66_08555 [Amycolatopsis sp.]|nr:hypothetical protein [Amycolatopsis sp.]